MNSARVKFQKKEQEAVAGRKKETWVDFYTTWADLPAMSVREQTDVNNRSLTGAITMEVRICEDIQAILDDLKRFRAIYKDKPYTLNSSDPSRSHEGWVRILASRTD